ncbi:hypothetical protein [Dongia mobilis]|uniref:hypothetical protein n=1 Tax=Dongia mobilis TaxID=578943 RepID=UPI00105F4F9E|nr:hypothetical protein [Dongia mobilis]
MKPITYPTPKHATRRTQNREVIMAPTVEDVAMFHKLQETLRPLTTDGSRPSRPGVIRAVMRAAIMIDDFDPGLLVDMLEGVRLPKSRETPLPDPKDTAVILADELMNEFVSRK